MATGLIDITVIRNFDDGYLRKGMKMKTYLTSVQRRIENLGNTLRMIFDLLVSTALLPNPGNFLHLPCVPKLCLRNSGPGGNILTLEMCVSIIVFM